jgi:mono/diheme cytochrome c family protein
MKGPLKIKNNMKNHTIEKVLMMLLMVALIFGCEKANDSKHNPPSDHAISKDGYMHKSGLEQPLVNCVSCHGTDLKGGSAGVSCFECHGTKW